MTGSRRAGWMLAAALLAVVPLTLLMPMTGEILGCLAIMAVAAFIMTL
ncbi:hypothetical protein EMIT0P265_270007 [Pseudomonas zeae]